MVNINTSRAAGFICALFFPISLSITAEAASTTPLDLQGYADAQGAISIQYKGGTIDPYFTLQALLMASENGLDISSYAPHWANWLAERQKPDGTFDRYCRNGPVWAPCKTADADDALMAIWLKYLDSMPGLLKNNPVWKKSYDQSAEKLSHLLDPARGVYMVSPVYQYGLFMDNLEVLSYRPPSGSSIKMPDAKTFANNIHTVFWDAKDSHFLVSTQLEQKAMTSTFYPDQVAQLFPLLVDFKLLPSDRGTYYKNWMQKYRATWLAQSRSDFAWGLVAVIALKQGDRASASCWLRDTESAQRTSHWIVTDEVARQILVHHGVTPAKENAKCQ